MPSTLASARYGKDIIRLFRVVRNGACHIVVEYNITALLEGQIDTSYTQADNTVVVATDSIKNITYYLAKTSPHVLNPERFALHLGTHLVSKYAHINKALITIESLRWSRIPVAEGEGKEEPHPHSFVRDGDEKRFTKVVVDATKGKDAPSATITSGFTDLLVLKTTNSSFENFIRDEYTTLVPVSDRLFSTSISLSYTFTPTPLTLPTPAELSSPLSPPFPTPSSPGVGGIWDSDTTFTNARATALKIFATDNSASVQATLYKICQRIIEDNESVGEVECTMPNKHYIPVDMKYIGVDNTTPENAEVFLPVAAPSGLIQATVTRI